MSGNGRWRCIAGVRNKAKAKEKENKMARAVVMREEQGGKRFRHSVVLAQISEFEGARGRCAGPFPSARSHSHPKPAASAAPTGLTYELVKARSIGFITSLFK
jgi:hypothetical protein